MAATEPEPGAYVWAWLPAHQAHVAYTLAHADSHIEAVGSILYRYLEPGPFDLANERDGDDGVVVVRGISPLPEAVRRHFADALTQLRSALEHALFAEIERAVGRDLTEREAKAVEMPASTTAQAFKVWSDDRRRISLFGSSGGQEILRRVRLLQPYWHTEPDTHPLRLLVDHTNHAKHRAPSVAATLLGRIVPDDVTSDLTLAEDGQQRPVAAGDVLARGAPERVVGLDIWPMVSVKRPATGSWQVVMHELDEISTWVRDCGVPMLVAGTAAVHALPPGIDITVGYQTLAIALQGAERRSAFQRSSERIQAAVTRPALAEMVRQHDRSLEPQVVEAWMENLADGEVLAWISRMGAGHLGVDDLPRLVDVLNELAGQVRRDQSGDAEQSWT